ncbi:patatin-like phospholipase family protein [Streptomyces laurentii]|uniref:patatin-like phospholipase family protein n=1 Tax=Streptomyces laurentii TaxID=39478 RepID=UPI00367CA773
MTNGSVAFVLGGGGVRGAHQVGMVRALFERGIKPDLLIGTSAGSIQGALLASDPTIGVIDTMTEFWREFTERRVMKASARNLLDNALHLRPTLTSHEKLRTILADYLGEDTLFENLQVPYQACAASIERATARYFDSGPLIPAVMASCAVPGLWPPMAIGKEHYVDGGVVETVPVSRAVSYGATTIYVLRLRQREPRLAPPRWPWQLGSAVYEVSRRHHLGQVLNHRPDGVVMHVLPSGEETLDLDDGMRSSAKEDAATVRRRMEEGYRATNAYLDAVDQSRILPKAASATGLGALRVEDAGVGSGDGPVLTVVENAAPSSFVRTKLNRYFDLCDGDRDGRVGLADFTRLADRVTAAFGRPGSPDEGLLRAAYAGFWSRLTAAADRDAGAMLERESFTRALARLVGSDRAYSANVLPLVAAVMDSADADGNGILSPPEVGRLLRALGVADGDETTVIRRLDSNNDGVITLDELNEAFQDYFTSDDAGAVGNMIFG